MNTDLEKLRLWEGEIYEVFWCRGLRLWNGGYALTRCSHRVVLLGPPDTDIHYCKYRGKSRGTSGVFMLRIELNSVTTLCEVQEL